MGALLVGGCAGTDYSDGLRAEEVSVAALTAERAGSGCPDPALAGPPRDADPAASALVVVTGAVSRPGVVPLRDDSRSLRAVLAAAGAAENEPPSSAIRLIRSGKVYDFDYLTDACAVQPGEIVLQDGDLVRVPRADETYVTVIGEVGQQGRVKVPPGGMTVLEAIASARGTNNITAQRDVVYLVRRNDRGASALKLSASDMLNNPTTPVPVRHNDVVVLPPSGLAQWDRFWRQLLSFLGPAIDKTAAAP
jgi:polysaccharide export outer membrane protein